MYPALAGERRPRAQQAEKVMMNQQVDARKPEPQFHPLTEEERRDLRLALERFLRENNGKIIDARTSDALASE
jgi:hypothetical protein